MIQDFGAGITVDDLIGLTADEISQYSLPHGEIYQLVLMASKYLLKKNYASAILTEIWGDGHTVWRINEGKEPLWVTPTGGIVRLKDE